MPNVFLEAENTSRCLLIWSYPGICTFILCMSVENHCRAPFFVFDRTSSLMYFFKFFFIYIYKTTNSIKSWRTGWVGAGIEWNWLNGTRS